MALQLIIAHTTVLVQTYLMSKQTRKMNGHMPFSHFNITWYDIDLRRTVKMEPDAVKCDNNRDHMIVNAVNKKFSLFSFKSLITNV